MSTGRQASVMTTSAAAMLGERAVKLEATASAIETCSKGYHQAEEAAKGLFNRIGLSQDGKMPNGMSQEEWMRNAIMNPQGAFNDMWSWEKYELGYSAAESIFGWGYAQRQPLYYGLFRTDGDYPLRGDRLPGYACQPRDGAQTYSAKTRKKWVFPVR